MNSVLNHNHAHATPSPATTKSESSATRTPTSSPANGEKEDISALYKIDVNDPGRRNFLDSLCRFWSERGAPLTEAPRLPISNKNVIDLYRLYMTVKQRGGFIQVSEKKVWKEIAIGLELGNAASTPYSLRKIYAKNLLHYECRFDRGNMDPSPILARLEAAAARNGRKRKAATQDSQQQPHIFQAIGKPQDTQAAVWPQPAPFHQAGAAAAAAAAAPYYWPPSAPDPGAYLNMAAAAAAPAVSVAANQGSPWFQPSAAAAATTAFSHPHHPQPGYYGGYAGLGSYHAHHTPNTSQYSNTATPADNRGYWPTYTGGQAQAAGASQTPTTYAGVNASTTTAAAYTSTAALDSRQQSTTASSSSSSATSAFYPQVTSAFYPKVDAVNLPPSGLPTYDFTLSSGANTTPFKQDSNIFSGVGAAPSAFGQSSLVMPSFGQPTAAAANPSAAPLPVE